MKNNLSEKESENLIYSIDEENLKCADCIFSKSNFYFSK